MRYYDKRIHNLIQKLHKKTITDGEGKELIKLFENFGRNHAQFKKIFLLFYNFKTFYERHYQWRMFLIEKEENSLLKRLITELSSIKKKKKFIY